MTDRLLLDAAVRDALLAHAREGAPEEVCGVLVGDRAGDDGSDAENPDRVTAAHRVDNVAEAPRTRYELDPKGALDAIERAEADGDAVIGFYHSHPAGPARPSETDRAQATWAGYVYAIVLPEDDAVRAWRWTGGSFEALAVEIA